VFGRSKSRLKSHFAHNHFRPLAEVVVVMVFDIGKGKGRKWKVEKGRSRGLLLKDGIGRGGKREGKGMEVREKREVSVSSLP